MINPDDLEGVEKEAYEELLCTYEADQITEEHLDAMIQLIKENP